MGHLHCNNLGMSDLMASPVPAGFPDAEGPDSMKRVAGEALLEHHNQVGILWSELTCFVAAGLARACASCFLCPPLRGPIV